MEENTSKNTHLQSAIFQLRKVIKTNLGGYMLREIKDVHQESTNLHRKWFSDDYFDLIVWYSDST